MDYHLSTTLFVMTAGMDPPASVLFWIRRSDDAEWKGEEVFHSLPNTWPLPLLASHLPYPSRLLTKSYIPEESHSWRLMSRDHYLAGVGGIGHEVDSNANRRQICSLGIGRQAFELIRSQNLVTPSDGPRTDLFDCSKTALKESRSSDKIK
jgi:hypothetical protein